MPHTAIVVFTATPLPKMLDDRASGEWRLNPDRARQCEFLVCTQKRHNPDFGVATAPHRAAFLIARISGVIPSPDVADRWLIEFDQYTTCNVPNIWGISGHRRYPIWYTTLEELRVDLAALPHLKPLSPEGALGMAESMMQPVMAPSAGVPASFAGAEAWRRMDAILAQIDRVPDVANPINPLEWDEHGLPR